MRHKLEIWLESLSAIYEKLRVAHVLSFALLLILLGSLACSSAPLEQPKTATSTTAATPAVLPIEVTPETKNPLTDLVAVSAAGKPLFEKNCAFCHGATGASDGAFEPKPPMLNSGDAAKDRDGEIFLTIKNGKGKSMPAMKRLTDEQIWQVTAYVRTLEKK